MENHQALVTVPQAELPADLDVFRVGEILAKSGYFKDVKDMAQAVAKILAGREMGFGPIASLTGVYIQQGRPCYSANMIAAAIKKSRRYDYRVKKLDAQSCELEFYEGGKPVGISSFSLEDAKQADLLTGNNAHSWKHYPRNMLFARAITNGARFHCPDTFGGIPIYTPEELNVVIDGETGEAVKEAVITPPQPQPTPLRTVPKPEPRGITHVEDEPHDLAAEMREEEERKAKPQTMAVPIKPDNTHKGTIKGFIPGVKSQSQPDKLAKPYKITILTKDDQEMELDFWSRPNVLKAIPIEKWDELVECQCEFAYSTKENTGKNGKVYVNHTLIFLDILDAPSSVIDDSQE
jgi:hypothetical protein